ncbi:MAG: hypothetical protein ABSH53_08575 [Holophaga sp.]|jgi:uncharacterized protein HemX
MTTRLHVQRYSTTYAQRQVEGEGILRMLLLAFALAMPMGSMAYLKIQHTRLSYEMSEVRDQIRQQEEYHRTLLLQRSRFQRDEAIQDYADRVGLVPRKQSHLVPKVYTQEDQRLAKLVPPGVAEGL